MFSGSEAGSFVRLVDSCITQLLFHAEEEPAWRVLISATEASTFALVCFSSKAVDAGYIRVFGGAIWAHPTQDIPCRVYGGDRCRVYLFEGDTRRVSEGYTGYKKKQ